MIWLLIICTHVDRGTQCLPAQIFHNANSCTFALRQYLKAPDVVYASCGGTRD